MKRPALFSSRAVFSPSRLAKPNSRYPIDPNDCLMRPATPALPSTRMAAPGQSTSCTAPNRPRHSSLIALRWLVSA